MPQISNYAEVSIGCHDGECGNVHRRICRLPKFIEYKLFGRIESKQAPKPYVYRPTNDEVQCMDQNKQMKPFLYLRAARKFHVNSMNMLDQPAEHRTNLVRHGLDGIAVGGEDDALDLDEELEEMEIEVDGPVPRIGVATQSTQDL